MTRCLVTKRIVHLLCIAVLFWLYGAVPEDLSGRFEPAQRRSDLHSTDSPGPCPASAVRTAGADL